jgi:hypothetical protein
MPPIYVSKQSLEIFRETFRVQQNSQYIFLHFPYLARRDGGRGGGGGCSYDLVLFMKHFWKYRERNTDGAYCCTRRKDGTIVSLLHMRHEENIDSGGELKGSLAPFFICTSKVFCYLKKNVLCVFKNNSCPVLYT